MDERATKEKRQEDFGGTIGILKHDLHGLSEKVGNASRLTDHPHHEIVDNANQVVADRQSATALQTPKFYEKYLTHFGKAIYAQEPLNVQVTLSELTPIKWTGSLGTCKREIVQSSSEEDEATSKLFHQMKTS